MNKYQVTDTSVCRVIVNCLLTYITTALLVSYCVTADDIPQSTLPEVNLPEDCSVVHLNGFNQAIIVSQKSDRYAPNYLCKILISLHGDYLIKFSFDKLDLPDPTSEGKCLDSVQFFNRVGQTNVQMTEKICGSKKPTVQLQSNSSSAMVIFSTDSYQERTGFRLRYERVQSNNPKPDTGAAVGCSSGNCPTSGAASTRLERSLQQSTVVLLVSLVSLIIHRYSGR